MVTSLIGVETMQNASPIHGREALKGSWNMPESSIRHLIRLISKELKSASRGARAFLGKLLVTESDRGLIKPSKSADYPSYLIKNEESSHAHRAVG